MFSAGRSTTQGTTPADVSACLVDCTPLQETILLTKSGCLYPNETQLKSLHVRVCRIMVAKKWEVSKKDSKRKALLLLTRLCFHAYCLNQVIPVSQQFRFMNVSRSQYAKRWQSRFNQVMDDFNEYLSKQEVIGISKYYNRARD